MGMEAGSDRDSLFLGGAELLVAGPLSISWKDP